MLLWEQLDKVAEKLLEFNAAVQASSSAGALTDAETGTVLPQLTTLLNDTSHYHVSQLSKPMVDVRLSPPSGCIAVLMLIAMCTAP